MLMILQILAAFFLEGGTEFPAIVVTLLCWVGKWKIFRKSGLYGWWALLPGAKDYQIARCAGREPEGRVYSLAGLSMAVLNAVLIISPFEPLDSEMFSIWDAVLIILILVLIFVRFTYGIRVYSGLCEVYNVRKIWTVLWIFDEVNFIPALVWGFSKKYQPAWEVEELKNQIAEITSRGSVAVMDQGLSVNLHARTATDFFVKKVLLRDIHMNIPQGHMVLLLGGSGAGKTTFLNAINGYEKAKAQIMLNGINVYSDYKKVKYDLGFVPQSEMMRGKDTVYNTLLDSAKLRLPLDSTGAQRKQRVKEVMEIFGLTPVKSSLVEKLSGGQKKRLSISIEFLSNPALFILDEPDSGLDGVMARELMEQLRKIADTGKIVIVITHTPDRVIDLFDDVIVLAKDENRTGRLAFFGPIPEARTFFGQDTMEHIVKSINRKEEGGDGRADEFIEKYAEVYYGRA